MSSQTLPTKVLVVDDSLTVRMTIKGLLEDENTTVVLAENGKQGIELLQSEHPDCLLLDYEMPDINGLEFLTGMPAGGDRPPVAVVMLTGMGSESVAVEAMKRGAQDYLVKNTMTPETLRHAIQGAIGKVAAERERAESNKQVTRASRQLAEANVELSRMNRLDPLTQVFNRRALEESLKLERERCLRNDRVYSIVMMDVDHFKLFNDSQGHQAGDDCLRRIARCAAQTVRAVDMVGRYGGEEFLVLLPDTDLAGAQAVAERIRNAVCDLNIPHPASKTADRVTVSIGVAAGPTRRWEEVVKQADDALYTAKENGRNRVCVEHPRTTDDCIQPDLTPRGRHSRTQPVRLQCRPSGWRLSGSTRRTF